MFCSNCGKELAPGEVCTCANENNDDAVQENAPAVEEAVNHDSAPIEEQPVEAPAQQPESVNPVPQQNYYNPAPQQQSYYNPQPQQGFNNVQPNNINAFPGVFYDPTKAVSEEKPKEKVPARTDYPEGYRIKRKYVAVILAATLGVFGIHNFYLGDKNKALAQLLVATVGGIVTFGAAFVGVCVWATVEAVLLLTEDMDKDFNGYKIQTFEEALAKEMGKDK